MEDFKGVGGKISEEGRRIKREVANSVSGYILGALGLVAGLAWNDAIKALIESIFPSAGSGVILKFIYAVLITFAVVITTIYVVRMLKKGPES